MALAREIFSLHHVPQKDLFAYTPTVFPVVHHEWGTGVLLYLATKAFGAPALLAIRYLLAFSTIALASRIALRRGGVLACVALVAFLVAIPLSNGFTTVRGQDFTLYFTCVLLFLLEWEREGRLAWVYVWP